MSEWNRRLDEEMPRLSERTPSSATLFWVIVALVALAIALPIVALIMVMAVSGASELRSDEVPAGAILRAASLLLG